MAESVNEKIQSLRKKYGYSAGGTGSEVSPKISELRKKYGYKSAGEGESFAPPAAAASQADPQIVGGTGLGAGIVLPTQQQAYGAMAQAAKQNHEKAQKTYETEAMALAGLDASLQPDAYKAQAEKRDQAKTTRDQFARIYYFADKEKQLAGLAKDTDASKAFSDAGKISEDIELIGRMAATVSGGASTPMDKTEYDKAKAYIMSKYGVTQKDIDATALGLTERVGLWKLMDELTAKLEPMEATLAGKGYDFEGLDQYGKRIEAEQKQAQELQKLAQDVSTVGGAIGGSVASVPMGALQGLDYLNVVFKYLGHNNPANIESYVPISASDMPITSQVSTIRGTVAGNIRGEDPNIWSKAAAFLYQTGLSMADSTATIALFGPGSIAVMGSSSASNTALDIVQRGGSNNQALIGGLAAGVAEGFFEKFSVDKLLSMSKAATPKAFFENLAKQSLTEASEETLTEIANILSDAAIMGENSNTKAAVKSYMAQGRSEEAAKAQAFLDNIGSVVLAALGGAISGAGMGGVYSGGQLAVAKARQYADETLTGQALKQTNQNFDLLDVALQLDQNSKAYQIATAISNALDQDKTGANISAAQWGRLRRQVAAEKGRTQSPALRAEIEQATHPDEAVAGIEELRAAEQETAQPAPQEQVSDPLAAIEEEAAKMAEQVELRAKGAETQNPATEPGAGAQVRSSVTMETPARTSAQRAGSELSVAQTRTVDYINAVLPNGSAKVELDNLPASEDAFYDETTDTIKLNAAKYKSQRDLIHYLGHELVHNADTYGLGDEMTKALAEFGKRELGEDVWNEMVQEKAKLYQKFYVEEKGYSRMKAAQATTAEKMANEVAADFMAELFDTGAVMERFSRSDRTGLQKLRDALVKFRDRLIGEVAGVGDLLVQGTEVRADVDKLIQTMDGLLRQGENRGTMKKNEEERYSVEGREESDARRVRAESRDDFIARCRREGRTFVEGRIAAYGYRDVPRESAQQNARQILEEVTALGEDGAIIQGEIEWNANGFSGKSRHGEVVTIEGMFILINDNTTTSPKNAAAHEVFHLWKSEAARQDYVDVLEENLIFNSAEFLCYQNAVAEAYLGGPVDIFDKKGMAKLKEEVHAYISGDIHEGANDEYMRPMFRDYDAVRKAWEDLKSEMVGKRHSIGGVPLADTNTPEFRAWFHDDSGELTNPDGTPKIFLRGSVHAGSTQFRGGEEAKSRGIFFTEQPDVAEWYASQAKTREWIPPKEFIPRNLNSWSEAQTFVENDLGRFVSLERDPDGWAVYTRQEGTGWKLAGEYENTPDGLAQFNADYGRIVRENGVVNPGWYSGYLSAERTLIYDAQGRNWNNIDGNGKWTNHLAEEAWGQGYDMVIIRNVVDGGSVGEFDENDVYSQRPTDVYVVRDPAQFKSAYNTGSFDRNNPDVRFSVGGLNSDERGGMMGAQEEVRGNDRERTVHRGLVGDYQGDQNRPIPEGAVRTAERDNRGQVRYRELTEPERDRAQRILMPAAEESREWRKIIRQFSMDEATEMIYNWAIDGDQRIEQMKRQIPGFAEALERVLNFAPAQSDAETDHSDMALRHFGETYNWNETGYLLKDGSQLDFSGKHNGGPGGYRTVDHREVSDAIGLDYGGGSYSGAMVRFMSEGNIRITPENNGINLSVAPTREQEAKLARYISRARGEVLLDIDDREGNTVVSVRYPKGASTERVINDIRRYFEDGTEPSVSDVERFRYSISPKPRTGGNTGNVNPETGFQRGSVADSFMRMWNVGAQDEALSMLESVITRLAQLEADASERRLADLRSAVLTARVTEDIAERNRERIERLIAKYGMMPQTSAAQQEARIPKQIDDETYVAGAVQTVMAAGVTTELIRDELAQDILSGNAGVTYARIGDPATLEQVDKEYEKYGHDAMMRQWKAKVNGNEAIGKLDIARAEKLYVEMASSKDPDMGAVLELVAEIAAAGTQAGQAVQAMTLLKKMTPTGQLYYIQKAVDRLNKDPRQKSPIIINVKLAEKLAKARTREEINAAIDELISDIAQQVPVSIPDKWNTWRYFAMLGNPRTHIRNLLGNAVFAPARLAKDAIGTLLEKALPQNQRTKALTVSEALREFAEQDAVEMQDILRGGGKYNPSDMIRDKRKIFKRAEWLNKATQKNSELLEKEDWVFLSRAYQRALAGFLSARGVTDADTLLDTPEGRKTLNEARIYAVHEAQRATYRDMSKLAGTLNHLKRNHKALGIFLDGIVPFTKTPINIVKRGVEYSPLGLVKTIYDVVNRGVAVKQIEDGKTVKRDFKGAAEIIDELSANLTGTGVALVGVLLSHLGLLTAGLGADDEDKFKELYGEQAYSLNIPGVGSYTIDWMAPVALPLFVGAEIYNTLTADYSEVDAEQVLDAVMDGMASILEPMLSLSMLDGLNDALSANKYGDSEDAIWTLLSTVGTSYVAQGVPTVMGQLSRTLDSDRRTTFVKKGEGDVKGMLKRFWQSSVQGKIPFYENEKMAYIDAWGRADTTGSVLVRAFENFLSPGYINSSRKTDVEAELERLAAALKDTGVMPDRAQKYFTVDKETYAMSQDEYQAHLIDRGQTSYALVNDFLHDRAYDGLTDKERAKVIGYIYDYAAQSAKYHTTEAYERDTWIAELDDYISRGGDAVDYLTMKVKTSASTTMSEVAYQRNDLTASEMGGLILGDVGASQRAPSTFTDPYAKGYVYELNGAQQARYTETYDRLFNERFPDLYASDEYRDATPEERKELVSDLRADVAKDTKREMADWLWEQGVESKLK